MNGRTTGLRELDLTNISFKSLPNMSKLKVSNSRARLGAIHKS